MPRYRFWCEYLGNAFFGWQAQNQDGKTKFKSVQSTLEDAFAIVLRKKLKLVGAGRTDSGVHARGLCVHFDFDEEILDLKKIEKSINGLSKRLIRIRGLELCDPDFHARHSAVSRSYSYTIFIRPVALYRDFGWECGNLQLDIDLMEQEAKDFIGYHDFIDFCIPRNDGKTTHSHIFQFKMERPNDYSVCFQIQGNRFLHKQIRAMVGTLFDVGRGRHPRGTVQAIFNQSFKGERTWAPPQGLVLESVNY